MESCLWRGLLAALSRPVDSFGQIGATRPTQADGSPLAKRAFLLHTQSAAVGPAEPGNGRYFRTLDADIAQQIIRQIVQPRSVPANAQDASEAASTATINIHGRRIEALD